MSPMMELERTLFGLSPVARRVSFPSLRPAEAEVEPARIDIHEGPDNLVVVAEVPGFTEKEVTVSFQGQVLTLTGEHVAPALEGYTTLHRERATVRLSRSVRFTVPVDVEHITAVVKDGVLTVTLPKAERGGRTIPVQASA